MRSFQIVIACMFIVSISLIVSLYTPHHERNDLTLSPEQQALWPCPQSVVYENGVFKGSTGSVFMTHDGVLSFWCKL